MLRKQQKVQVQLAPPPLSCFSLLPSLLASQPMRLPTKDFSMLRLRGSNSEREFFWGEEATLVSTHKEKWKLLVTSTETLPVHLAWVCFPLLIDGELLISSVKVSHCKGTFLPFSKACLPFFSICGPAHQCCSYQLSQDVSGSTRHPLLSCAGKVLDQSLH